MLLSSLVAMLIALAGDNQAAPRIPSELRGEGPLQNDTRLPVSDDAAQKLAEGDRAWTKAGVVAPSGAPPSASSAAAIEAMEAWHTALAESEHDATVPGLLARAPVETGGSGAAAVDPDLTLARRVESVESAVERRVTAYGLRALWSAAFDDRARAALARARRDEVLIARVVREFPFTDSAVRACLMMCDAAFERGDAPLAQRWLARAREQGTALPETPSEAPAADAISKRERAVSRFLARDATGAADREDRLLSSAVWDRARSLTPSRRIRLVDDAALPTTPPSSPPSSPRGVRAGIVALEDGAVLVQTSDRFHRVDPAGAVRVVEIEALQGASMMIFGLPFAERGETWALDPGVGGGRVVAVVGRARREQGNACVCIDARLEGGAQSFLWAYSPAGFHARAADPVPLAELLGPGVWEFQPGPIVLGARVFIEARQWDESDPERVDERATKVWILALDLETGGVLWKRLLASGAVLESDATVVRLAQILGERGFAAPADPIALHAGRLFVSTGLGSASLIDTSDGRLDWSFRSRRRTPVEPGWRAMPARPTLAHATRARSPSGASAEPSWAWAPGDSDFVYLLRDGPDRDGRGILRRSPEPIGDGAALLGADGDELLMLRRAEARRGLGLWNLATGGSTSSVLFGREDELRACIEPSPSRVVVCTDDGLYLFDKARDLYLLDFERLPREGWRTTRTMCVRGDEVWVLGDLEIQVFEAR